MGKNAKRLKRKRMAERATREIEAPDDGGIEDEVDDDALATTIETLRFVAARPALLHSRALRDLRGALHPLVEMQLKKYDAVDYCAKVTRCLQFSDWSGAYAALDGARAFVQLPKQGTVQRWVRACDDAPVSARLRLLDGILRAAQPAGAELEVSDNLHDPARQLHELQAAQAQIAAAGGGESGEAGAAPASSVRRWPDWTPSPFERAPAPTPAAAPVAEAAAAPATAPAAVASRVVLLEKGADRKPPNVHDLRIWACAPRTVAMEEGAANGVLKQDVPSVPGAFVVSGALSRAECSALVTTAETLGYVADHPVGKEAPTGIDACEWLIDESILAPLFARVKAALPSVLPRGARLAGINQRCVRLPLLLFFTRGRRDCKLTPIETRLTVIHFSDTPSLLLVRTTPSPSHSHTHTRAHARQQVAPLPLRPRRGVPAAHRRLVAREHDVVGDGRVRPRQRADAPLAAHLPRLSERRL